MSLSSALLRRTLCSSLQIGVLPILTRELTEQSSRPRLYIVRTVYAVILYLIGAWVFLNHVGGWNVQSYSALGQGRILLFAIGGLQFCALYLFLPPMTCGLLTSEKERDTLALLLLTRTGPWSILIGKLISRLVTMACFIGLSLPLIGVAYSFGGFESGEIVALAWTLLVTGLQVGSLALACSAWCRTTAGAFLATYLVGALLIFGPLFLDRLGPFDPVQLLAAINLYCVNCELDDPEFTRAEAALLLFGPMSSLYEKSQNAPIDVTVIRTVPMLLCSLVSLVFARVVLWKRAFVPPSNWMLKLFRHLDAVFIALNKNRVTRGIVLTREQVELPDHDPIRWRETRKRSLGTTRYRIRLLLVLEFPVLFAMLIPYYGNSSPERAPAFVVPWILWIVVTLIIAVHASGLIGLERSRQTLDVLLTTPLSSETIVREKFAGLWRIIFILWVPLATAYAFQLCWLEWIARDGWGGPFEGSYVLIRGVLALAVYPVLIAWIGFHMGMRCRSQARATLLAVSLIAAVCVIPIAISYSLESQGFLGFYEIRWLSPATVLYVLPRFDYSHLGLGSSNIVLPAHLAMLSHFFIAGAVLLWLWSKGLATFARFVSRNDGQIIDDEDIDRLSSLRKSIIGDTRSSSTDDA